MVHSLVDKLRNILFFILILFLSSCSNRSIYLKYKEAKEPQIILLLKNADLYFKKVDVLNAISRKKNIDERVNKILKRAKNDIKMNIYAKDFDVKYTSISNEEIENYILLNEIIIEFLNNGTLKIY